MKSYNPILQFYLLFKHYIQSNFGVKLIFRFNQKNLKFKVQDIQSIN